MPAWDFFISYLDLSLSIRANQSLLDRLLAARQRKLVQERVLFWNYHQFCLCSLQFGCGSSSGSRCYFSATYFLLHLKVKPYREVKFELTVRVFIISLEIWYQSCILQQESHLLKDILQGCMTFASCMLQEQPFLMQLLFQVWSLWVQNWIFCSIQLVPEQRV